MYINKQNFKSRIGIPIYKSLESILTSEWNNEFEKLRQNRMIQGWFRYGSIRFKSKKHDNIGSAIKRLQKYNETGNGEFLVDAANLCMIEFTQENHDDFHFESIDDGEHVEEVK